MDIKSLKRWFESEKRDLPWRNAPTPYAVWVSEVMLQQTQVAVVIPYFERWMQRFPTIRALADAQLDEVIKMWEGLGYYSRARNLHEGARYIMAFHGGEFPQNFQALQKIKGLGPYTIGAIRSFAFHEKTSAVDGNVVRVLARYFLIEDDISKPKTLNKFRQLADDLLPDKESWITNEALIELGATVCTRNPKCSICPLRTGCKGYIEGVFNRLPFKSSKQKIERLYRAVAVLQCGNALLVRRGKKGEVMSDLYEFPYFETSQEGWSLENFLQVIKEAWKINIRPLKSLPDISHGFTRYQARLTPFLFESPGAVPVEGFEWLSFSDLDTLAFSSGHRRIYEALKNN